MSSHLRQRIQNAPSSRPITLVPSASSDCAQCDCECREDQKDGSSLAHPRARSAQRTSATPNAIAIHASIILASSL
jgi:hypothetical protein